MELWHHTRLKFMYTHKRITKTMKIQGNMATINMNVMLLENLTYNQKNFGMLANSIYIIGKIQWECICFDPLAILFFIFCVSLPELKYFTVRCQNKTVSPLGLTHSTLKHGILSAISYVCTWSEWHYIQTNLHKTCIQI